MRCLATSPLVQSALLSLEVGSCHPTVDGAQPFLAVGMQWTLAQLLALHLRTVSDEGELIPSLTREAPGLVATAICFLACLIQLLVADLNPIPVHLHRIPVVLLQSRARPACWPPCGSSSRWNAPRAPLPRTA